MPYTLYITNNSVDIENLNLTEITGEAGSGKTQLCIYFLLRTILPLSIGCLEKGALYISTVQKLSTSRFDQFLSFMAQEINVNEKNIAVTRLFNKHLSNNEYEQFTNIEMEKFITENSIKTVIIDSITGIADTQFIKDNNEIDYRERTKFLKNSSWTFKRLIQKHNLFFFVTNNVASNFKDSEDNIKPNLGLVWENTINTRILLKKQTNIKGKNDRSIKVLFSNYLPLREIEFTFTNQGFSFIKDNE